MLRPCNTRKRQIKSSQIKIGVFIPAFEKSAEYL